MYRIDVYESSKKGDSKKITSHWYPTLAQAKAAKEAISSIKKGTHVAQFREGAPVTAKTYGGYTVSEVIKDDRFDSVK